MPIWCTPAACSGSSRRSVSRKASASSSPGTRRFMDVSPEHLVEQANERFQLQDYYGAIHLLEEVVATGRAFADAHHLLGLSYSLVGQPDTALEQLDRALTLNPNYIEALIHRALVLNELARDAHEHFQRIVRERPSFLDAAAMLGLACYLAGDGLGARAVWEELRTRRPEDPRVEAYLALLSRSDVTPVGAGAAQDAMLDEPAPTKKKRK